MLKVRHLRLNTLSRSGDYHYTGSQLFSGSSTNFALSDGVLYELEISILATFYPINCIHGASTGYSGHYNGFDLNPTQKSLGTIKGYFRRNGATLYSAIHPDYATLSTVSQTVYSQTTQDNVEVSAGVFKNLDWTGIQAITAAATLLSGDITFSLDGSNQWVVDTNTLFWDAGSMYISTSDGYYFVLEGGGGSGQYNHSDGYPTAYAITKCGILCNWDFGIRVAQIS